MLKKLFSHTLIYGLAPQIAKLLTLVTLPIITKDLTDLDFGVAGVITAYTAAISVLSILGLRLILVNTFYKSPGQYKWAWRQIYGFLIIWNLFYTALLVALLYFIIPQEAMDNKWLIILLNVGPLVFFGPTAQIGSTYYQINQKPMQIGIRTITFGVLGVIITLYTISYLKLGYLGWFWSTFIVGILLNISYWYPLIYKLNIRPIFNYKWRLIKIYLKVSLPTVPHYYSGYLLDSSDKMVMDLLKVNTADIGKYNAAYLVGNVIQQIGIASGLAVGPLLMECYKKGDDRTARGLIFLLQILFFCGTFILCIWLKEAFSILINNEVLANMYPLGIIIIMSYNYRPMYLGANNKLFYTEKTNVIWKVTFVAGLINVALNLLLIPYFSFEAAAYTTFISLMFMGYSGFYLKVFKEIHTEKFYPLVWLTLTILLTFAATFLVESNYLIKTLLSLLAILISLIAIKKLRLWHLK